MNADDLSHFSLQMGIEDALQKTTTDVPQQTLADFAALVVRACAQVQFERSCQRQGYDKYHDGEAIAQRFGLTTLQ